MAVMDVYRQLRKMHRYGTKDLSRALDQCGSWCNPESALRNIPFDQSLAAALNRMEQRTKTYVARTCRQIIASLQSFSLLGKRLDIPLDIRGFEHTAVKETFGGEPQGIVISADGKVVLGAAFGLEVGHRCGYADAAQGVAI